MRRDPVLDRADDPLPGERCCALPIRGSPALGGGLGLMGSATRACWARHGMAVALVALAALAATVLSPYTARIGQLFVAAVAVAAWQGGRGPGLLATVLGTAVLTVLFGPPLAVALRHPAEILELPVFVFLALLVSELEVRRRRSESRNRALLKAVPDMIFRIRRDGLILDFEPGAAAEPLPAGAFLGRSLAAVLPGPVAGAAMRAVADAVTSGDIQLLMYDLPVDDGRARAYEARLAASGADEVVAVVRDVTEQRRREQERERQREANARAEERARIAANVHDGVLGRLSGTAMLLGAAARDPARDRGQAVRQAAGQLADAIRELRAFVHGGAPLADALAFRRGLEELADGIRAAGARAEVACPPGLAEQIGPGAAGELLLVAREAVTNALRHAGPTAVAVRVERSATAVVLEVQDDGRGIGIADERSAAGMGFRSMRERVVRLGGAFRLDGAAGTGTTLSVELPLDHR